MEKQRRAEPPPSHRSAHQLESSKSVRAGLHPCNKAHKMGETEPAHSTAREMMKGGMKEVILLLHPAELIELKLKVCW